MPYTPPPAAAGGSALDANNNQIFPAALGVSTVAAGSVSERVLTRAGNSQFAFANADITDVIAMPSLENYHVGKIHANGTNTLTAIGCQGATSGTIGSVTKAYTSYSNSRDSFSCSSTTTAGSAGYVMAQTFTLTRGNAARRGGFYSVQRFMPVLATGHQAAVGLSAGIALLAGEPSAIAGPFVGMICDSADANWQMFVKPSGAAGTKVDTGLAKVTTGALLALYLYAAPNGTGIGYYLENEETQAAVASGTFTLTLPASTTAMIGAGIQVRNGAAVTVATLNFHSVYVGSRY